MMKPTTHSEQRLYLIMKCPECKIEIPIIKLNSIIKLREYGFVDVIVQVCPKCDWREIIIHKVVRGEENR